MAAVPEGAQLSEDGQWWWDGTQWQAVDQQDGGQDGGGQGGDAGQATAEFAFDNNGVLVSPDDLDNPDNHVVLHHDAGTKVSFAIWNMGQAAGTATVTVYVDDQEVQTWTSGSIAPGTSGGPDDGYIHGCGRYPAGQHVFRVVVTPGHSGQDSTTNSVDID
jgi:hypothetical protein